MESVSNLMKISYYDKATNFLQKGVYVSIA
jgi:hypothetical protein